MQKNCYNPARSQARLSRQPARRVRGVESGKFVVEITTANRENWFHLFDSLPGEATIIAVLRQEPQTETIKHLTDFVRQTTTVRRVLEALANPAMAAATADDEQGWVVISRPRKLAIPQ